MVIGSSPIEVTLQIILLAITIGKAGMREVVN
jgi:hypothetical protein